MITDVPFHIHHIVYTDRYCPPIDAPKTWTRYEFRPDGRIIKQSFVGKPRKCTGKETFSVPVQDMWTFYRNVCNCVRNETGCYRIIDDCSGTMEIVYDYYHSETVDRGLHSDRTSINQQVGKILLAIEASTNPDNRDQKTD